MDCIAYINDLQIEIDILRQLENNDVNIVDKIKAKENQLKKIKDNLSKLSNNNIEYRLYCKILDGKTVSKAVEEISEENYINDIKPSSPSNIWKKYKNLQKILKQE